MMAPFKRADRGEMDLTRFIALIYGDEAASRPEIVSEIRSRLGKNAIGSLRDMRAVSMMLDRQRYPTRLSILFSDGDIEFAEVNGVSSPIDPHDYSGSRSGVDSGSYEPHVAACLRRICRPGRIFFDIGANVGFHTLLLSQLAGPEGQVFAFEPNSENARLILLGIERIDATNVDLLPIALSNQRGWAYFSTHVGSNGGFVDGTTKQHGIVVPTFRIDELALPNPEVIKIDVEGAEYRVLKGGEALLDQARPFILCEYSLEMTARVSGVAPALLPEWLAAKDYEIKIIDRTSDQLIPIASAADLAQRWPSPLHIEDLLFVPAEKAGLIAR